MPTYVMLSRFTTDTMRSVVDDPSNLLKLRKALESREAKINHEFHLLGEWDHCTVFEASDNFRAYYASLGQELTDAVETSVLPAMDMQLFQRLITAEAGTVGPHEWQIQWWAKVARAAMRWHGYSRWVWEACKPLTITGREHFKGINGPCIVVGNHTSHLDALVLFHALPQRVKWNVYFGAAADRWFVTGRKELVMQPWYQSLVMGTFPIQRGGGSRALDYPKWLLKHGANLVIFPEGTRSTSRKMAKFRHGVSILATEFDVPVVPIYLTGLNKLRPKGSREIHPGPAGAHFQPAVRLAKGTSIPDATKAIYDSLNRVHERVQEYGPAAAASNWTPPIGSVALQPT
ncbi:MAG TPA: 1-acyl-sn-glycerol-3-phosphate acyltransferase [Pseudomonadales bacterium]|nr:1-acyl-sn-glycerol-3-phosphate acyltransferase [Pseudomonadales bacterium]